MAEQKEIDALMSACRLCPRNCGADRLHGKTGFCGVPAQIYAARAALHYWEEPCISGTEGSGAVFFTGCVLRCVYCQNREIAAGRDGLPIDVERLGDIFLELQDQGANNINLVTPTHYVPQIAAALQRAKDRGLKLPVVYNTGSYEKVETLKRMEGLVDIYLPDLKYKDPALGKRYSQAQDYFETAWAAIEEMVRQVPEIIFDEKGLMKRGVIVRHMVLPGHTRDSRALLDLLHETYGDQIWISIMSQYTPLSGLENYPEIARRITPREYAKVVDHGLDLGITNAYLQEGEAAKDSFIPPFDHTGINHRPPRKEEG